jgi:lipid-binding SYLF domain-containing protein
MFRIVTLLCASCVIVAGSVGCQSDPKTASDKDSMQQELRTMERDTLNQLYSAVPGSEQAVKKAAGYAVFSNFGLKILVAGSGSGKGLAVDNKDGKVVYMRMAEVQAGLGMGAKKFRLVWVFDTNDKLNEFINSGWTMGGQATAAAKTSDKGGAMQGAATVAPGVWVYQLTDAGLAAELTAKGTKYYKDEGLN